MNITDYHFQRIKSNPSFMCKESLASLRYNHTEGELIVPKPYAINLDGELWDTSGFRPEPKYIFNESCEKNIMVAWETIEDSVPYFIPRYLFVDEGEEIRAYIYIR